jgi:hypothetical protein
VGSWAYQIRLYTCVAVVAEAAEDAEMEGCADVGIDLGRYEGWSAYLEGHQELWVEREAVEAILAGGGTYRDLADGQDLAAVLVEWVHWVSVALALLDHESGSVELDRSDPEAFRQWGACGVVRE